MQQAGADEMVDIGIVQHPNSLLSTPTVPYDLPREADIAKADYERLRTTASAVLRAHSTKRGLGVAAPQIGIDRRIAIMKPWGEDDICLLNASIIERSDETDVRWEGCLSLFDSRGEVRRPLRIVVQAQRFDGSMWTAEYRNEVARLVCHELDHLGGHVYLDKMNGGRLIDVATYRQMSGTDWVYDR